MSLRTPLPARRVRRMHVRAHADDDARHAATLLADALRTASLPAPDEGRLVVIRRLALGRISVRVSPSSLALHIERVAHDVMSQAVTFDVPAAGAANAVVFPDRSDAIVALAGLYAGGAPADEWFWPEVVNGWRADASRAERWSLLLQAAHGVPGAAIVAAAVIDRAIRAGVEDALLSSVPTGQGARWLRLEGWTSLSPDAAPPMWRPPSPLLREVIRRWRGTWGPDDDRLIWLTTLLTVLEHPACAADHRLPGRVAFALRTFLDRAHTGREPQYRTSSRARSCPVKTRSQSSLARARPSKETRSGKHQKERALCVQALDPAASMPARGSPRPIRRGPRRPPIEPSSASPTTRPMRDSGRSASRSPSTRQRSHPWTMCSRPSPVCSSLCRSSSGSDFRPSLPHTRRFSPADFPRACSGSSASESDCRPAIRWRCRFELSSQAKTTRRCSEPQTSPSLSLPAPPKSCRRRSRALRSIHRARPG